MTAPGRELRRARSGEAASLAELYLRARRTAAGIPPPAHSDDSVHAWLSEIVGAQDTVWVAVTGGELAALMVLDGVWVHQLYVAPEHLRHGHGAALLGLAQRTGDELLLWTFETNTGARAFYEAHGFRPDGPADSDNEERTPAIRYRWTRGARGRAR
jgi:GNAT superfamily N-acetyltransferase